MFEQLFNNHFLYSLSLTLLHFLWQGLLVGLILKSLLSIIDKDKSKLRYGLATFSMLASLLLAVFTFAIIYTDTTSGLTSNIPHIPLNNLVSELTLEDNTLTYQELVPSIVAYSLPYLSIFWLATIVVLAGKLLLEVKNVNQLPLQATLSPTDELLTRFNALAKQIKLSRPPKLLISLKVDVPMAIGWLKPVVLLPASMVTGLDSDQLEMLLLHELAHIRRHDYLVNFFQTLIELLFFFHPCIHWIGKQMRNEREYCSDDVAVQHCGDAIAYAHTLTDTASLCAKKHCHKHTIPSMAMAASGGDLKARVVRLVDHHCAPRNDTGKWLAALTLLLSFALVGINQLLTTPLSYSMNSQFPWYDNKIVASELVQSPTTDSYLNETSLFFPVANNSIALQLLNSKENNEITTSKDDTNTLNHIDLHPEANSYQTLFTTNDESITEETSERKLIATETAAATIQSDFPSESADSQYSEGKEADKFPVNLADENEKLLAQTTNDKVSNAKPLTTMKQKKPSSALSAPILTASTETLAEITPLKTPLDTLKKSPQLVDDTTISTSQQTTELIQLTEVKSDGIKQDSYSQAIDEFEIQNNKYKAAHDSRLKDASHLTKSDTQRTIKEEQEAKSIDAKLLKSTNPRYPSSAKLRGLEMQVKVNFTVDRNGKVKDIIFANKHNVTYFKSAIRSAIRKWRFTPAVVNNDVVESKMSKIFSFSLQS